MKQVTEGAWCNEEPLTFKHLDRLIEGQTFEAQSAIHQPIAPDDPLEGFYTSQKRPQVPSDADDELSDTDVIESQELKKAEEILETIRRLGYKLENDSTLSPAIQN